MEDAVDPGTTRQLCCVDLVAGALYAFVKVHRELLNHPEEEQTPMNLCVCLPAIHPSLHSLEQSLCLARRIVWSEVLVLLHLLLDGEQLTLQLGSQSRQGVSDVVGQLLCRSEGRG